MKGFNVLRAYHQMLGPDWHDLWVPGSPSPAGIAPYFAFFPTLTGLTFLTAQYGETVEGHNSWTMQRGTDIGPLIPHIGAPNLYLPVIILLSGSKSHFGASDVHVNDAPAAVAVGYVVNLNLNCNGPLKRPPLPTGFVIAWHTVEANFTIGDFIAGLLHMGFDLLLQWGLSHLFNVIGKIPFVNRIATSIYERFVFRGLNFLVLGLGKASEARIIGALITKAFVRYDLSESLAKGLAKYFPLTVLSILLGSPVGYSAPFGPTGSGKGTTGLGEKEDKAYGAVRDYVNNWWGDDHPSIPPPAEPAPTPQPATPSGSGPAQPNAGPPADAGSGSPDAGGSGSPTPPRDAGGDH